MRNVGNALVGLGSRRTLARAGQKSENFERHQPFGWLVRAGFVARAITYGVIAGLAFALASGAGTIGAAPNQQGALALISRSPVGRAALVVICAGLLAYVVWKITQGAFGRGPEGGGGPGWLDRLGNLGAGATYLVFFVVAVRILTGSSGDSSTAPKHAAAGILSWPGGQAIVGVGGAALIAISLYQLYDAVRGGFAHESKTQRMGGVERRVFMALGHVGLGARALVFGVVGYFLIRTAIDTNPGSAVGIDGALGRVHHEPFGPWILGFVAVGLLTFAAFSLLEARFRRL